MADKENDPDLNKVVRSYMTRAFEDLAPLLKALSPPAEQTDRLFFPGVYQLSHGIFYYRDSRSKSGEDMSRLSLPHMFFNCINVNAVHHEIQYMRVLYKGRSVRVMLKPTGKDGVAKLHIGSTKLEWTNGVLSFGETNTEFVLFKENFECIRTLDKFYRGVYDVFSLFMHTCGSDPSFWNQQK